MNNQRINVHYHFKDIYTQKYVDNINMADHVASMLNLWHKILAAGKDLSNIHVVQALVLLLPQMSTWDLIKIQLFNLDMMKLTSETITTTLQAEANHHQCDRTSKTAMLAAKKTFGSKGKSKLGPRPNNKCRHCHEKTIGSASVWNNRLKRRRWVQALLALGLRKWKLKLWICQIYFHGRIDTWQGWVTLGLGYHVAHVVGSLTIHILHSDHILYPVPPTPLSLLVTPGTFPSLEMVLLSLRHSYRMVITRSPSTMPSMSRN